MQINTNYDEIVLALDRNREVENQVLSSNLQEDITEPGNDDKLNLERQKINYQRMADQSEMDAEEARREIEELKQEERRSLSMEMMAQANASSRQYLQLLMDDVSG